MQKIFPITLVAIGLSVTSASFSQGTATEQPKAEETVAPETNTGGITEDQAFPLAIGSEYIREEHNAWQIICVQAAEGKPENCGMYQLLKDDTGLPVAKFSILKLANAAQAAAGVHFITPLGTLLTAQASMRVDAGKVKRYPYSWCLEQGCSARFGLTQEELESLKKGKKAIMTIKGIAEPNNPLSLDLSLDGFTAAWNAINTK